MPTDPPAPPRIRRAEAALLRVVVLVLLLHAARGIVGRAGPRAGPPPPPLAVDLARDPAWRLGLLPSIGPVRAAAIVDDRRRNGPLERLEQLVRVHGIGPGIVASLRRLRGIRVHVRGEPVRRKAR